MEEMEGWVEGVLEREERKMERYAYGQHPSGRACTY